jgi:hypothetical protein
VAGKYGKMALGCVHHGPLIMNASVQRTAHNTASVIVSLDERLTPDDELAILQQLGDVLIERVRVLKEGA